MQLGLGHLQALLPSRNVLLLGSHLISARLQGHFDLSQLLLKLLSPFDLPAGAPQDVRAPLETVRPYPDLWPCASTHCWSAAHCWRLALPAIWPPGSDLPALWPRLQGHGQAKSVVHAVRSSGCTVRPKELR